MKPRALLPCVFVSVAIFFLSLVFHRQTHPLLDLSSSLSHIPHTLGYSIGILALNFPFLPKIFHLFFFFFFPSGPLRTCTFKIQLSEDPEVKSLISYIFWANDKL